MASTTDPETDTATNPPIPPSGTETSADYTVATETATIIETITETTTDTATNAPIQPSPPAPDSGAEIPTDSTAATATDAVDPQIKALEELKQLLAAAVANNEFGLPPPPTAAVANNEFALPPPPTATVAATQETIKEAPLPPQAPEETKESPLAPPATEETIKAPELHPPEPEPQETINETLLETPVTEETIKAVPLESPVTEETINAPSLPSPTPEETVKAPPLEPAAEPEETVKEPPSEPAEAPKEEVFIWGVPLIGDERSDTVLLKFLQAREFQVKEAFNMIKDCIIWRRQFGIEGLLSEDLGFPEMNKVVFMDGIDREGHPVCYNIYGDFQNAEFYDKAFGDAEKRHRFIKWRIQYLEKGIRELLDFHPGGVCSMVQVTDFKNAPQFGKHRTVAGQIVALLQDNYPEFIAKKIFINVPWWNLAAFWMMNLFTPRTKSKFVFASPAKTTETLFKYIAPEQVPVAYGGLSKENNAEFTTSDPATVVTMKPSSKHSVEIPAPEGSQVVWELRVVDWDVTYGAEFVPNTENAYTVIVQKPRKFAENDEPVIQNSFKFNQPGLLALHVENQSTKKKLLVYRFKVKSSTEST